MKDLNTESGLDKIISVEDTNIEAAENAAKNGGEGAEEAVKQVAAGSEETPKEAPKETQGPTEDELRHPTNTEDPFGMNDEKTSEASASQSEKTDAQVMADASGVTAQGGNTAAPQAVPTPTPVAPQATPVAQPAQPVQQVAQPVQQQVVQPTQVAVPQAPQTIAVPTAPGQQPVNPLQQAQNAIPKPVVDGVMMKAPAGAVQAAQNLQAVQAATTTETAA